MLKFRQWLNEQFLLKENNIQKEKDRWNSYETNQARVGHHRGMHIQKVKLLNSATSDFGEYGMGPILKKAFEDHPAAQRLTREQILKHIQKGEWDQPSHPLGPHELQSIYDDQRMGNKTPESHIGPRSPPFLEHSPIDHIVDKLADGDPAKDKKHLTHIVNWYQKRQFRTEDLGNQESHKEYPNWNTVHGTLKAFSDIKNKEHFPDIQNAQNQMLKGTSLKSYNHMSFPEFRTYVHKQLGLDKVNAKPFEHPDAKQVFEKDGTKINDIQSKGAAIHLGKCTGAKWCTGWEGPQNMYSHYATRGEIYHIHTNDGTHYQAHLPSHQFMDKEDRPVSPKYLAQKHPELKHFEPLNNYSDKKQDYPFR